MSLNKPPGVPTFTSQNIFIMETIKYNGQLDLELQELYIESSHWISDIDFVEDEVRFLKKALHKYHAYTEGLQLYEANNFIKILEQQHTNIPGIKIKVVELLKFIEPFVNDSDKEIGVDLVEKFIALETEIKALTEYLRLVKNLVFSFIEEAVKAGKSIDITDLKKINNSP